ncbi:DNA mismatch repair endonuclease MutL [Limosilactobacillus fermentum]|jgi:DNA mismatch repair protein MutL|uniref:DNA mismatch repair endonuclease MutL n=1 Tax=Limosilactobacillus fermentum TaxID=1613 RepID=UPI00209BF7D5|nr:DNA mismatch repair endonuclease MutL [Limosilactobacillus fermentum]MCO8300033.1 DNA mismatch repair endonuclease MutL [Limosilactobacillus fermentum]
MGKIHELDSVLADQIAAGEVIERPASIVKELAENSLDANSHRIDIIVEEAGLKSVRVIDDGQGIEADDVARAFLRHATSKIADKGDLFKVTTMGFRGEALPSIASVADVLLTTSTGGAAGSQIHIKGGEILAHGQASARPGTDILVSDLFYNTPARLKYLKSPHTELARIVDIVNRLALANPTVAFSLTHDGKEVFRSAGNGNLKQVVAAIYGVQAGRKMVEVKGEDPNFKVSGLVSLPELTRAGRQYMTIIINHRYVRNFQLTKALVAGYRSKLMVGRYPLAVINIDLDPVLVDVNVHPAKREVRLSMEPQLVDLLERVVSQAIDQQNLIPDVGDRADELLTREQTVHAPRSAAPRVSERASDEPPAWQPSPTSGEPVIISRRSELASPAVQAFDRRYQNEEVATPFGAQADAKVSQAQPAVEQVSLDIDDRGDVASERFPDLTYLGQLHGTYLLAQASDGLYIVDQHAAQERINYEYYREEIGKVSADQQNFLTPLVLNYSLADALKIQQHQAVLAACGLKLEPFGQNSFMLASHPTWFVAGQEEDTAREMIDWVLASGKLSVKDFRAKAAIMMSCKRAIKANHRLDERQAKALLARLPQCENPFNCPHGRPVTIHFTTTDLEKLFKRIQESHQPFADDFDDHED